MTIYKTRWFARWADQHGLSDAVLCAAVQEMTQGLCDAQLGGDLLKKRLARPGKGKRGGFRTIVATNGDRWFFIYGFAKNERANIGRAEQSALRTLAATLLRMPTVPLIKALHADEIIEVNCDD